MIRKLDDNGDVVLSGNAWAYDAEEVKTELNSTLRMFKGEFFRDVTKGVPWFESVFEKGADLSIINAMLKDIILNVKNVDSIVSLSSNYDRANRELTVSCEILTTSGLTVKLEALNVSP